MAYATDGDGNPLYGTRLHEWMETMDKTDAAERLLRAIFEAPTTAYCPLCDEEMDPKPVRNSLSRLDNSTYICNACGMREAWAPNRASGDTCLYRDELMGIAVVRASERGYTPWLKRPADTSFADDYVDRWNEGIGIDVDQAHHIVHRSMFG